MPPPATPLAHRKTAGHSNNSGVRGAPNKAPARGKQDSAAASTPTRRNEPQMPASSSTSSRPRLRIGVDWDDPEAKRRTESGEDDRAIVWLDIDNTLYKKSTRIAELMGQRIRAYFIGMGLSEEESEELHSRYYKEYGLAIRGLVKHHKIDPLDYDRKCDASLPLEDILKPDRDIQKLLTDLDRTKCRVFALTNAYKHHARRVLRLLELDHFCEGVIYCDYATEDFACKPELDYYISAMEVIGVKDPSKCYFVDDSALNVKAAKDLGWGSCVLFSEAAPPPSTDAEKTAASNFSASVLSPRAAVNGSPAAGEEAKVNGSAWSSRSGGTVKRAEGLRIPPSSDDFDEEAIQREFRKLPHSMRIRLLNVLLEACMPGDLLALSRALERFLRSTRDVISTLPDTICIKIFERLEVKELLRCRQVSKKWRNIAAEPCLWRSHALALTEGDPVPLVPPEEGSGWEDLVRGLYFRERNWAKGLAQRLDFFEGHSGFVTSIKLKGRDTLVTGSYDETIRVWDMKSGHCSKVLKAKAISCLDFLLEDNILCAGLYDTGRVMVWDMKTWELLQTLSGHNKGIRSVALSKDYLVSVGQDKAIVVWDWRSGNKIVRFGQQSNVSLGISIVDNDKIVAVTVDGIIRTFSIVGAKLIAQFDLHKLGGRDLAVSSKLAALGGSTAMLQWFAASGNTMTIASKDQVVHLQWREHIVAVGAKVAASDIRRTASTKTSSVNTPLRSRKESTGPVSAMSRSSTTSSLTSSTNGMTRSRRDSNASTASVMSTASARRSLSGGNMRSPTTAHASSMTPLRTTSNHSTGSSRRPPSSVSVRSPVSGANLAPSGSGRDLVSLDSPGISSPPSPKAGDSGSSTNGPATPGSPSSGTPGPTRYAPNLAMPPTILEIFNTPDMATGCVDPAKRRIVCSTFSSRAGSDRRLYSSTHRIEKGGLRAAEELEKGEAKHIEGEKINFVAIGGAWAERGEDLQKPSTRPLALVVDHESIVVGCQDGTVYRLGFVGSKYQDKPASAGGLEADEDGEKKLEGADAVIEDLTELRSVWKDLMLPSDAAADHPGRIKVDVLKAVGLK